MKSPSEDSSLHAIRHSTAHVLAMAVQSLWPKAQVTIGPVIENGFFYDFSFPDNVRLQESDLDAIEQAMNKIIRSNLAIIRKVVSREDALHIFKQMGEVFKVELIQSIPASEEISIYSMGSWADLCAGPHVSSTNILGAFKLLSIAGSYWRGNEKGPRLTRIYGTAWANKEDLDAHLKQLAEAKKRDHRVLGKQLGLFSFQSEAPANPFFHPKGYALFQSLVNFVREQNTAFGFEEVSTPLVMDVDMWKKSGHYDNYRENMYFTMVDDVEAAIKPMNCPGHCLIYGNERRSYRQLPIRLSEFGRVHRHERSGVTHGLMRVRSFTQDDAHIFCTEEQVVSEISKLIQMIDVVYLTLGFDKYKVALSTRPENSIGTDEEWKRTETALHEALKSQGISYSINAGEGAFYGPKIEYQLIDSIGRAWQCGTIQLDASMPARFGLAYQGADDKAHTPVMIHRAVLGSIERFMGIMIEHYAGQFPIWLAPVQVRLMTVNESHAEFCNQLNNTLKAAGVRVEIDERREKIGFKIREAQLEKIPLMIVIGDKEMESQQFSARRLDGSQIHLSSIDQLILETKVHVRK